MRKIGRARPLRRDTNSKPVSRVFGHLGVTVIRVALAAISACGNRDKAMMRYEADLARSRANQYNFWETRELKGCLDLKIGANCVAIEVQSRHWVWEICARIACLDDPGPVMIGLPDLVLSSSSPYMLYYKKCV
jgi:hypothetical protein